ncbi:RagB/SusD family nutrient uptake outer membrane protein [Halalkalibaculum sp. DA3122]|uniref:RagB/SusD family nutrient uptake outer membrane protein n=1 Tax=Halalkalibaculum sp. DA3122 TaxID=3373607 RepID=UPI003754B8D2
MLDLKNTSFSITVIVLVLMGLFNSCTDVTEPIDSTVKEEDFFQNDEEFISALGDAYGPLADNYGTTNRGFFWMQNEVSTDEVTVPTWADGGWEDGGVFIRMHRHTYTPDEAAVDEGWVDLFAGVNNTNRLIFQFESLVESGDVSEDQAATFIAELRATRAFYYYLLLDNFGNVPILTSFKDAPEDPSQPSSDFQEGRQAVFDFVESELLDVIDQLNPNPDETYGRMNRWGAHMVLARLYLNAEVYTGTPRWEDAITHANAIIESDRFSMASNYGDNFDPNNSDSPEAIFAIPYDEVFNQGFDYHFTSLHYAFQSKLDLQTTLVNGMRVMEEFYMSYVDPNQNPGPQGTVIGRDGSDTTGTVDERMLNNFYVGPQFDAQGNPLTDPASRADLDPNGPPVNHRPHLIGLTVSTLDGGARNKKWNIEQGATRNLNNDYFIFRYTEVLLIKAEALWRLNNNDSEALQLVNRVRQRAGVDDFSSLTADKLLAERGREMFYEGTRRQDLIRFEGKNGGVTRYNDPWWEKGVTEEYKNVFPIPSDQLESNTNLVQNPGY